MEKSLSIVIAVYNIEQYIRKCLDSLIVSEDRMQNVEVLVVNDGTPDNSASIAKEYENKYPDTFRVIDKENGGPGSAWNVGVKEAHGKYLRFLDGDDWLVNFAEFLDKIEKTSADLIFTDWYDYYIQDEKMIYQSLSSVMERDVVYDVEEYDWKLTDKLPISTMLFNFHRCTYRTSILKKHQGLFVEGHMYADMILQIFPLCCSNSFVYFNLPLYCYLHGREGQSINWNVRLKQLPSLIYGNKRIIEFYNSHPNDNKNVDDRLRYIIDKHTVKHLYYLKWMPYTKFHYYMEDFLLWLKKNYPLFFSADYLGCFIRIYMLSPFICWFLYHYIQPIKQRLRSLNNRK